MKQCSKCKEVKSLECFSPREDSKDGLRGHCIKCVKERAKRVHLENREERNAISKQYYCENKEKLLIKQKKLNLKHRKEKPDYHKDYYYKNRDKILAQKSDYIKRNLPKIIAKNVKRYAMQKNRTPKWLTKEHLEQMEAFYIEAARITEETGIEHHVDHIEPLQGKEVSGLHVPWNLQVIPAFGPNGNCSKGNRRN